MDGYISVVPASENYFTLSPSTFTPTAGTSFTVAVHDYDVYGNLETGNTDFLAESFDGEHQRRAG